MKRVILIFFLLILIFQGKGQPVNLETPGCEAHFQAIADNQNPLLIHFHDQSIGNITSWYWNFSDPGPNGSSTLKNPEHLFSHPGSFFVYLTVASANGQCNNSIVVSVTVHSPGACVADYHYYQDPGNQKLFHFNETSSGPVNRWHWTFGDGTVSEQPDPNHEYLTYGNFEVCLTAYHNDSALCSDMKCDTMRINSPNQCKAQFIAELDSFGHHQRFYKFTSFSSGNPNYYEWRFGDGGASSNGPAVNYQYKNAGQYKACLTIKKKNGPTVWCSDSICHFITAPEYYNLGGHLFTGNSPINNPVATGDTGIAYLYRKSGSGFIPVDTNVFTNLGYYTFPGILPGQYLVKSYLSPGSSHYDQYFPSYFSQSMTWGQSEMLVIDDSSKFQSHINMVGVNPFVPGTCRIDGKVVIGEPGPGSITVEGAEVVLYDGLLKPLEFTESDYNGNFHFRDLPFGSYYLFVEVPGKFSRYTAIWLDDKDPVNHNVVLGIYDHDVTGTGPDAVQNNIIVTLLPNPATNGFSIRLNIPQTDVFTYRIFDLRGQIFKEMSSSCQPPVSQIQFNTNQLPAGIYFVMIENEGGWRKVEKLVKW